MKENNKLNKYDPKNNIHFLNYIIGAEHSGNFQNMLNVFKSYIENYKAENKNVNNYIFYVNTIIILIEKCLNQNLVEFANILIINLNQFLQNNNIDTQSFDFKNSKTRQEPSLPSWMSSGGGGFVYLVIFWLLHN